MATRERIYIGVAWPYANGPLHLGHVAGVYLPADIFARYHRTAGNEVLMVSGSDQHGTPITVRAEQERTTPAEIAARYHADFLRSWRDLGVTFDLFTRTGTDNHREVTQDIFLKLLHAGYIRRDTTEALFCPVDRRFLPDRYVEGTCPFCRYTGARGDQCDRCGRPLNLTELVDPRCRFCGASPELRETEHFFLRLAAFEDRLREWVGAQEHWKPNVRNFTMQWLAEGLRDRAITRDIEWGIPVPVPGFERKRIYVWFEAVIGYLSASKEWAQRSGDPERWRPFWQEPCKGYYFIGKDNIPFHTIIWPSMLIGYGGLNLPYDVPANEHLTLESRPFSTSRNWAIWLPDFLSRYDPDSLRYVLSASMPETADTDFSWREFVRRNNDELVATYGNLAHRVLTMTHRNFEGQVPRPGELGEPDRALVEQTRAAFPAMGTALAACRFREGLRQAMGLAQEANRYLDIKAPWKEIRQHREGAATTLWTAITAINGLKTLLSPFLPFSSERLHRMLGFDGTVREGGWQFAEVPPGQTLGQPEALFKKLDEAVVEEETARLGQTR